MVPVGGGGLIGGVAGVLKAARPGVRVIGVQAEACSAYPASLERGEPVEAGGGPTIADGIAIKRPGGLTLPLVREWVDEIVVVAENDVAEAMVVLLERAKLVVEGAGAVGVAALLAGAVVPAPSGATVVVLSGGNVEERALRQLRCEVLDGDGRRVDVRERLVRLVHRHGEEREHSAEASGRDRHRQRRRIGDVA